MLAAVEIHPERSQLDFPRTWDQELGGRPLLERTLEAIAACPSIDRVAVIVPAEADGLLEPVSSQVSAIRAGARLFTIALPGMPGYPLARLRRLRRMAPAAWRAGWALPQALAERGDPLRWLRLCEREGAGRIVVFPDAAPCIDASLVEEMIAACEAAGEPRVRLSTLPPGAAGDILSRGFLEDIVQNGLEVDAPFRFLPGVAERDLDTRGVYHWFAEDRAPLLHRLTGDSRRGRAVLEAVEEALASRTDPGAPVDLGELARSGEAGRIAAGPFPAEIRIRLTDRVRRPGAFDLPRESREASEHLPLEALEPLLEEAASWEETRVILAGGEPTLHPEFDRIPELLERHRPGAVVLECDGLGLDASRLEAFGDRLDGIVVPLDATRAETYRQLRGGDLEEAELRFRELHRRSAEGRGPFVAAEMRLHEASQEEAEPFVDRWSELTPWVLLSPFRNRAGQLEHAPLHPYRLPVRTACLRLEEQAVVHPDGQVAVCDNDFVPLRAAGRAGDRSLGDLWREGLFAELRRAQARGDYGSHPLCAGCDDWCRRG